jgi:hypothetical protein
VAGEAGARLNGGQIIRWRLNRDSVEWVKREQIAVTGKDQVSAAVQREFQEFVVSGVAADADSLDDGNEDRNLFEFQKELLTGCET